MAPRPALRAGRCWLPALEPHQRGNLGSRGGSRAGRSAWWSEGVLAGPRRGHGSQARRADWGPGDPGRAGTQPSPKFRTPSAARASPAWLRPRPSCYLALLPLRVSRGAALRSQTPGSRDLPYLLWVPQLPRGPKRGRPRSALQLRSPERPPPCPDPPALGPVRPPQQAPDPLSGSHCCPSRFRLTPRWCWRPWPSCVRVSVHGPRSLHRWGWRVTLPGRER